MPAMERVAAVVLAAGEGKRLRTRTAKVLHEVGGRPLIEHVLDALAPLRPDPLVVVVGHLKDQVIAHLENRTTLAVQDPPRGTGDAVACALGVLPADGEVLVLSGDVPLVLAATLDALVARRRDEDAAAALATAILPEPASYGRIVRDAAGDVVEIVEARDATLEQRSIREVNAGTYVFDIAALRGALAQLSPDNDQGEYYLTDVVSILVAGGRRVVGFVLPNAEEMAGVNCRADLAEVNRLLNARTLRELQSGGVTVLDPAGTWVDADCRVGADTVLEPGVHLRRGCSIGPGCRIGAYSVLEGVTLREGASVPPLTFRSAQRPRGFTRGTSRRPGPRARRRVDSSQV
jgi:bifunctional UDP-N-acetylglucosamine pyrophosphorylase/glucosamine-1-phosphate N-acetyltransferase